ncbi:uncharacterized protein [Mycetomoellerius zeteki]|uniref:uncharacterized protein n=1 Tax=Mycetomoellerius zeteki TaxID=64791 RepID=UPI00084E990D|nr:PREDICTED: uncharacterized protein LOC108731366 [Trachymyrmex zeteki]
MFTEIKRKSQNNMQKDFDHEESESSNSNSSDNKIDDSKEYDSSSSEKNVNKESFKNNTSSILCTNKNISKGNKCQNQSSNVSRYNDGITARSDNSSKNMQNIDLEYDRDTAVSPNMNRCSSPRLEVGARTLSEE